MRLCSAKEEDLAGVVILGTAPLSRDPVVPDPVRTYHWRQSGGLLSREHMPQASGSDCGPMDAIPMHEGTISYPTDPNVSYHRCDNFRRRVDQLYFYDPVYWSSCGPTTQHKAKWRILLMISISLFLCPSAQQNL
nr:hypothetical protein CFP56_04252 [Quercus suber]